MTARLAIGPLVGLTLSGLSGAASAAQPTVRFEGDRPRGELSVSSGFADSLAPLAVGGAVGLPAGERTVVLWGGLTTPLLQPDLEDHRLELGVSTSLLNQPWDVWIGAGLREVSTRNVAFQAVSLGTVVGVYPGYHAPDWTVAAEAELWTAWATWLSTTRYAEEVGGVRPWSGWTGLTAADLKLGLRAGFVLGDIALDLRVGYQTRGDLNLVNPPLYATLGLGYRF